MLPIQMECDARYSSARGYLPSGRWKASVVPLFLISFGLVFFGPSRGVGQQGSFAAAVSEKVPQASAVSAVPILWNAEEVVQRSILADPILRILENERKLARSQGAGQHKNCAIQSWMLQHLDQRIVRRQQEIRAQVLKLHFGLAEVQSQTLVLDQLHQLLKQYSELVAKIAAAQEATESLIQKRDLLQAEIQRSETTLYHSLAQIRIQLRALLQCEQAEIYWPEESIVLQFEKIDVERQVVLAKQQRSDISVWQSIPRVGGTAEDLAQIEKVLAAGWLVVPTPTAKGAVLKVLSHGRVDADLKRLWGTRRRQMEELARAKELELETEVRLKAVALDHAYRTAEQAQSLKQQAAARLEKFERRQALGWTDPELFWEAAFQFQRDRSVAFRLLHEARQAEIDLDFATASSRPWKANADAPPGAESLSE